MVNRVGGDNVPLSAGITIDMVRVVNRVCGDSVPLTAGISKAIPGIHGCHNKAFMAGDFYCVS